MFRHVAKRLERGLEGLRKQKKKKKKKEKTNKGKKERKYTIHVGPQIDNRRVCNVALNGVWGSLIT